MPFWSSVTSTISGISSSIQSAGAATRAAAQSAGAATRGYVSPATTPAPSAPAPSAPSTPSASAPSSPAASAPSSGGGGSSFVGTSGGWMMNTETGKTLFTGAQPPAPIMEDIYADRAIAIATGQDPSTLPSITEMAISVGEVVPENLMFLKGKTYADELASIGGITPPGGGIIPGWGEKVVDKVKDLFTPTAGGGAKGAGGGVINIGAILIVAAIILVVWLLSKKKKK